MDDHIEVGVHDLTKLDDNTYSLPNPNKENLVIGTYKKIIMKDEMTKLNNKTSKYIGEFNKINSSLLCKYENISKEDCTFEVLRYAICNYEFNQVKYKYFRSVLKNVERTIDWKSRVQGDSYARRYDWDFDVNVHWYLNTFEQKNTINYAFACR